MLRMRSVSSNNKYEKLAIVGPVVERIGNWSFRVVDLQRTARKCTKNCFVREQPLFCSLNLLFGDVLVAVAVAFCVSCLFFALTCPLAKPHEMVFSCRTSVLFA